MFKSAGLLILRVAVGSMLMHHGFEKLANINNFADAFVRPIGLPFPITLSYLAAFSEIGGSWMLITGLATRLGGLLIAGTMSVAIYHALVTTGFNIYLLELLVLYMGGALSITLIGGGMFSIDYLIYDTREGGSWYRQSYQIHKDHKKPWSGYKVQPDLSGH